MHWLTLALIGWLPGAVLFRLPVAERDRRAALPADERLFWAVVLSTALSLSIVLALAAAHRYSFARLLVADAAVSIVLAAAARFRLRLGPRTRRIGPTVLVPILLVCLGAWRFFPSAEYLIGGKDPGVYMNEGIQIAQRGALVVRDQTIIDVPPFARDLFFPSHQNPTYYSVRFMGFFIRTPDAGTVVGQFPHLYPASIAIGYGVDGLTGARMAVGVWAILGLLALYFAGARFVGRPAAAAAAALLALNVIQVWFARYPNAEVVMQALLFAALLANARAHVDGDAFFAPVAGALLGLLLFLRFDAVIAVAAVLAGLGLGFLVGQRPRWTFWPPLVAAILLYALYLAGPMRAYAELPRVFLANLHWWQYAAMALGGAAALVLLLSAARSPATSTAAARWAPPLLACVVIALAAYAFAVRHPGGKLTDYDAYALRTFAIFYFTVPALIAAIIGYMIVARGLFWRDPALMVTVTAFSLFFFYKIRIVPDHFWMARRFLPVILPGGLLLVGAAALTGVRGRWLTPRVIRGPIGIVFLGLLAFAYARAARPVLDHVEYAGIIARLEHLASVVSPDDLLIVESRNASDVHVLALPLALTYARHVLVLANPSPDKVTFAAFLDRAQARYRRVLFLGGGGTDLLSSRWSVEPVESDRFQVPEYDAPYNAYPRFVRHKEFDYSIYAFTPPTHDDRPFDLDVGVNDDLNVLRFNAKEQTEGRTIRWTRGRSFLTMTRLRPIDRAITLWMSNGGRPAAAPPADVTVTLGQQVLGTVRVGRGFAPYTFDIPAATAADAAKSGEPVRLTIQTSTWNPQKVLGTPDDRDLGVMLDRAAVR